MLRVSDITSFLTCPRLAYFRIHNSLEEVNEYHAVREIYLSLRKGYDYEWALERFLTLYPEKRDIFTAASSKFRLSEELDALRPIAWEVTFKSEKYNLKGIVDEILEGNRFLLVMLRRWGDNFTFKERMRLAATSVISGMDEGFVYYAYDGFLAPYELTRRDKYNLLRILEKLRKIESGFLPEKRESKRCEFCPYREDCDSKPQTFASRFF